HVTRWTFADRPPLGTDSSHCKDVAAAMKATATAPEPNTPEARSMRRPTVNRRRAPGAGGGRVNQGGVPLLPLEKWEVVPVRGGATAEDRDDDRQSDGDLGRRDDRHE